LDFCKYAAPAVLTIIPSPAKAVLKQPQSRRFAHADDCSMSRSVWTAAVHRRFLPGEHIFTD